jgi:hypothetical protein
MVVWAKAMPRSAIIWTRSRELSLNVRIPPDAQDDDFLVKVPPFKEILCRGQVPSSQPLSQDTERFNSLHQKPCGVV